MRITLIVGTVTAALCAVPIGAAATPAYSNYAAPIYAGPGTDYPVVGKLARGAVVNVHGCLTDYSWCDVNFGPNCVRFLPSSTGASLPSDLIGSFEEPFHWSFEGKCAYPRDTVGAWRQFEKFMCFYGNFENRENFAEIDHLRIWKKLNLLKTN